MIDKVTKLKIRVILTKALIYIYVMCSAIAKIE